MRIERCAWSRADWSPIEGLIVRRKNGIFPEWRRSCQL
jgi:hypothetical protein